jgi:hypothetical protein
METIPALTENSRFSGKSLIRHKRIADSAQEKKTADET